MLLAVSINYLIFIRQHKEWRAVYRRIYYRVFMYIIYVYNMRLGVCACVSLI